MRQPSADPEAVVHALDDVNTISRFVLNGLVILCVFLVISLVCCFIRSSSELTARVMYALTGDTKMRVNAADVMGASILPGSVLRVERMIIHDIGSQLFDSLDVYVQIDFGTNMPACTRVRQVQPVNQAFDPGAMVTIPPADRPKKNRVVFTDKLEFNVRPIAEGQIKFRVKDQDLIGGDTVGTLSLDIDEVMAKARENTRSNTGMNYPACLSYPLVDSDRKQIETRMLLWVTLAD
jgi:hypothetical protein